MNVSYLTTGEIVVAGDEGYPVPGVSRARGILASLLAGSNTQDIIGQQLVVHLLQAFPILASEKGWNFCARGLFFGGSGLQPLAVCAKRKFNLETVKGVHEVYPDALSTIQEHTGRNHVIFASVLCIACMFLVESNPQNNEVIQYLAREYPDAIGSRDSTGFLPIHHLLTHTGLSSEIWLETIKILTDIHPENLSQRFNSSLLLEYAFAFGCDAKILEYMFEITPKPIEYCYVYNIPEGVNAAVDVKRAKMLAKWFPVVKNFVCIKNMSAKGCRHLLAYLAKNRTIKLAVLPISFYAQINLTSKICVNGSIMHMLKTNRSLEHIMFQQEEAFQTPPSMFSAIRRGLEAGSKNIEQVSLIGVCLNGWEPLVDIVSSDSAPKFLRLFDVKVEGMLSEVKIPHCSIECLQYNDKGKVCTTAMLDGLFNLALSMPRLKGFSVHLSSDLRGIDITAPLVSLIRLTSLIDIDIEMNGAAVSSLIINEQQVWEALKYNRHLCAYLVPSTLNSPEKVKSFLDAVMSQNTTLKAVTVDKEMLGHDYSRKIHNNCNLNIFNRGTLRRRPISGQALMKVITDKLINFDGTILLHGRPDIGNEAIDLAKFNVLYGLLMENPSLWCDLTFHTS